MTKKPNKTITNIEKQTVNTTPKPKKHSGLLLFAREILKNPRKVGAFVPSSKRLAKTMAAQIPVHVSGLIIELGAGTGVVTQALLDHLTDPHKIIVIERSQHLVKFLHKHFPHIQIIHGDAMHLPELLGKKATQISAIVSSLPLRSLPPATVAHIERALIQCLPSQALFIQFTYHLFKKKRLKLPQLQHLHSKIIWTNLPPARVDVFCKL